MEIDVIVDYRAFRTSPISGGIRILASRRAPARALGLVALSATVLAAGPGAAGAIGPPLAGEAWAAGGVRFEAVAGDDDGLTVAGSGTYRGAVEVRRHGRGLAVVNVVGFEDYVRGIDEVPPSWPAAALQAQAIAARTYAAHKAASTEGTPWRAVGADICATPRCQVYNGSTPSGRLAATGGSRPSRPPPGGCWSRVGGRSWPATRPRPTGPGP